jgi:pimeloyl-ACP methyl ester carboxylesterase
MGTVKARRIRRLAVGGALAGAAAGAGYAVFRAGARRWRADDEELVAAGNTVPADVEHHFIDLDDGGRCHAVERGSGPALVLVHGVTLSSSIWAPQVRLLAPEHRVIAVDLRGHGQSVAGEGGYAMDRLADDLVEALVALEVRHAVLVGHSMGGMVALHAASRQGSELHRHVGALALVSTAAGSVVYGPAPQRTAAMLGILARQGLERVDRRGKGLTPSGDLAAWSTRLSFGRHPVPADVELARSLTASMSPASLAELAGTLLAFDARADVSRIALPTRVMVGTRDLLTPPRMARALASAIPGAELTVFDGAGHMLMLERTEELNAALHDMAQKVGDHQH